MHPLEHAKKFARDLRHLASVPELRLAASQEATARILGYRDWHHLATDPSHEPGDVDARRWRAVRELAATGTSEDILGIVNRLLPDPAIGRVRKLEDLLSVSSLHPVTRGYDDFVRMLHERHGTEFEIVAENGELVHSGPLGRGVVHRDGLAFLGLVSDAYWSIFGLDPDHREVYRVDRSHLRFDKRGFEAEAVFSTDWLDRRPGLRIAAAYDGTISTHVLVAGAPDIEDPERALNVWRNVNGHGGDVDFHGVTVRSRENGLDVFSIEAEDAVRMLWTGREGCFGDPDEGIPITIPRLEFDCLVHRSDSSMEATDAIMATDGPDGHASRVDVERARRFMEAWGVALPEDLATQWLASPPVSDHSEAYRMLSVRDMGDQQTELERRAAPDRLVIAEDASGPVLWVLSDGRWHTRGQDHGVDDNAFLAASRQSWEDAAIMSVASGDSAATRH